VSPVVRLAAGTQGGNAGEHGVRKTEEMQGQIDEMRAQVKPEASARTGIFAPALTDERAKTVHMSLEVDDFAEDPGGEDVLRGKNVALPATILKDGEQTIFLASYPDKLTRFGKVEGERLVDDDVLTCAQRGGSEREVTVVWSCDDDKIEVWVNRRVFCRTDGGIGKVGEHALRAAGADDREMEAFDGTNQRSVKGLAGIAIAKEADAKGMRRSGRHSCTIRVGRWPLGVKAFGYRGALSLLAGVSLGGG
jgi:hypothetical protein